MPKDTGIGASSKRREDVRFLSGKGLYTQDIALAGQTYAVMVRSNVAHGKIKSINTAKAAAMPAEYSANITSPCKLNSPQTSRCGIKAEMISV